MTRTEAEERLHLVLAMQGDPDAFAALVAPRRPRLLLLLAAAIGDWHEAEDGLQEALWQAFTRLRTLRAADAFDGWLRAVVLNEARDRLRQAGARTRREGLPAGGLAEIERLPGRRDAGAESEPGQDPLTSGASGVLAAIALLPPAERRVGTLVWLAGLSPRETAGTLGVPAGRVHTALHRARRRFRWLFYRPDDYRRDVDTVPGESVALACYAVDPERLLAHWSRTRPDLRATPVEPHRSDAAVKIGLFWEAPALAAAPPQASVALPLDQLAEAAGFDLEPFGDRLRRFSWGGRPYFLPYRDTPHAVLYNADLLGRLGLPLPPADWTWEEFFGYCDRCKAAGIPALTTQTPCGFELAYVAEQLGCTETDWTALPEAVDFTRRWNAKGYAAPFHGWIGQAFFEGRTAFYCFQAGQPSSLIERWGSRFRWGIAPMPRFARSDPHLTLWHRVAVSVRGVAPDPLAAFRVVQALFTDGPPLRGDELPAHRTPAALGAWREQPLPLGKECLWELDRATGPLGVTRLLPCLPDAGITFWDLLMDRVSLEEALATLRAAGSAHQAGAPLQYAEN